MRMLVTAAALTAIALPAWAGNYDPQPAPRVTADPSARAGALSTASSRSSSAALSNSSARAVSSQSQIQGQSLRSVNRNNVTINNGGGGQSSGQSGGQSGVDPATLAAWEAGHGGGGNGQFPAASAYAPSFAGANPCTGPASSLGAQFQLFGLSVGGQTMDRVCQLLELHQQAAALEYLCDQDRGVRNALARTGSPCIADRQASVTPVNNPTPAPQPRPKWCSRARPTTEASKAYVLEQCGS
jgi:hypothetical protein